MPKVEENQKTLPQSTSFSQIQIAPQSWHMKRMILKGVLSASFENNALYVDETAMGTANMKNAIWLNYSNLPKQQKILFDKMHGKSVIISGIFNADEHGQFGLFAGSVYVDEIVQLPQSQK